MANKSLVIVAVAEQDPELSFEDLCHACLVAPQDIQEMIEYGVIDPRGVSYETWRFDLEHVQRIRKVLHLQHDLEVNLAGAALVLELIDEMEKMRAKVAFFEKNRFI